MAGFKRIFVLYSVIVSFVLTSEGFIKDWLVIGPFKFERDINAVKKDFIESLPELDFREGIVIAGKECIKYNSRLNFIDFERIYPDADLNYVACYTVSNVYFDKDVKNLKLFIGSDDLVLVYVNGEPVHFFDERRRWHMHMIDLVEGIEFKKGWNQIVVKTVNIVSGYAFFACLTDENNNILYNLETSLDVSLKKKLKIESLNDSLNKGVNKGRDVRDWMIDVYTDSSLIGVKNPEEVNIDIDINNVINDQFIGIGVQGDLFFALKEYKEYTVTKKEKEMIYNRVRKLRPPVARLFLETKWWNPKKGKYKWNTRGMKYLHEILDLYKSIDTAIVLTVWKFAPCVDPRIDMNNAEELAVSVSKLMTHLLKERKYNNVEYLMIFNEPDQEFGKTVDEYRQLYVLLDRQLRKEGIREEIKLVGPDESGSLKWFKETADKMDDLIDVYDAHHYEGVDALVILPWVEDRSKALSQRNIKKPWFVGEFGMWHDLESPYYGRFAAEYIITAVNNGAAGLLIWEMHSDIFPGFKWISDGGLWRFKNNDWRIRPVYYAYSIFTRNMRAGLKVISSVTDSRQVLSLALKNENDRLMFLVSNRANFTVINVAGSFKEGDKFLKYEYSSDKLKEVTGDNPIEPEEISVIDGDILKDKLKENSFILYVQQ